MVRFSKDFKICAHHVLYAANNLKDSNNVAKLIIMRPDWNHKHLYGTFRGKSYTNATRHTDKWIPQQDTLSRVSLPRGAGEITV